MIIKCLVVCLNVCMNCENIISFLKFNANTSSYVLHFWCINIKIKLFGGAKRLKKLKIGMVGINKLIKKKNNNNLLIIIPYHPPEVLST